MSECFTGETKKHEPYILHKNIKLFFLFRRLIVYYPIHGNLVIVRHGGNLPEREFN